MYSILSWSLQRLICAQMSFQTADGIAEAKPGATLKPDSPKTKMHFTKMKAYLVRVSSWP